MPRGKSRNDIWITLIRRVREALGDDWTVFVGEVPLTVVGELLALIRTAAGCTQVEAEAKLKACPFHLLGGLSRGRAEELASRLHRERVTARVAKG